MVEYTGVPQCSSQDGTEGFDDSVGNEDNQDDLEESALDEMTGVPVYTNQDGTEDFGDFVSNDDEEMDLEWIAEPWDQYDKKRTPHVFYPVRLGDLINERYLVEHKLGHGGFSTVWMAHDLRDNRDVALKIMLAGDSGDDEIRIQDEIVHNVRDVSHLITYLDTFLLPGDGCQHRAQVFPLVGPYICYTTVIELSMASRMSAARQLLEALENLHEAGIVHRDLNERNCMWGMTPLHTLSRTAKYEVLGRPLKESIPFVNLWKQGELVMPVEISEKLRTEEFYLGDFGLAKRVNDLATPRGFPPMQFCSPDRLHGKVPTFACDMWSYMVLFSRLYCGHVPFSPAFKSGLIGDFVNSLGPLPEEWKGLYTQPGSQDSWYDQNQTPDPKWSLESNIAGLCPDADPIELSHVNSIMSRVFTYDPEKRLTATQLLRDPSFRAIMENYGC
ncbi:uncharacterized protein LDX57_007442 [Aspergillus melleus]|uniref:uncharacterized protein n=1 Tax=Aspergillus melleus TaxID=138277 RepID=UPI001E8E055B|nr:uncharacterized protein LDX57_007442 [Aspergillus melleus]KAH8429770.1 hypothetical protein LDX57_007442 [Aspergillus melleus]